MNTLNFDDNCKRKLDETYLVVYVIENTTWILKMNILNFDDNCKRKLDGTCLVVYVIENTTCITK